LLKKQSQTAALSPFLSSAFQTPAASSAKESQQGEDKIILSLSF
jgi:hypothetical protein